MRLFNFIEWKRAHRGFFRLLLVSWHELAASQRQAIAAASASRLRHDAISLTLHFEILQKHTSYRRRLAVLANHKMQRGGPVTSAALTAAYEIAGARTHGAWVLCFRAWSQLVSRGRVGRRVRTALALEPATLQPRRT